jgi:hypothetical protein
MWAVPPQPYESNTEKTKMNELAVRRQPQLSEYNLKQIMEVAPVMHAARLFGTKTMEQAAAIMIKGHFLGFDLASSFEFIHVIEDKPSLSPRGALALIQSNPDNAGVEIKHESDANGNPVGCSVTMKRKGGTPHTARFTLEDAKRADLIKPKSGWEKYPLLMCQWRAVGYCADVVWADIGLKRADEYGADLTPAGDVIEGSWSVQGSQPTPDDLKRQVEGFQKERQQNLQAAPPVTVSQTQPVPATPGIDLQTLLSKFSAAEIMSANGGKIPATNFECAIVWEKLEAQELEITGGK